MYHHIVRGIVAQGFRDLSQGKFENVLRQFAPTVIFSFAGDHALGGEWRSSEEVRLWFQRVHRLFPDLMIEPLEITISGLPWNTVVVTRFRIKATLSEGLPYSNEGVQFLRIRWGKIIEDRLIEDTEKLCRALEYLAQHDMNEAGMPPLENKRTSHPQVLLQS
jgi:ketosteroid isomerase-like protein